MAGCSSETSSSSDIATIKLVELETIISAEAGFYEIVDYYKQFDRLLSYDFIQESEDTVQRLIKYPKIALDLFFNLFNE
ncbi:MAG: hypothetical protein EA359_18925 [Balneolaceae bacterium]|nr:MAG: hypothetical protein EA359_18925 [Balneolaceae bacterium]